MNVTKIDTGSASGIGTINEGERTNSDKRADVICD